MTRFPEAPSNPPRRHPGMYGGATPMAARPAGWTAPGQAPTQAVRPRGHRSRAFQFSLIIVFALLALGAGFFGYLRLNPSAGARQPTESAIMIFSGRAGELTAAPGNAVEQDPSDPQIAWIRSSLKTATSAGATDGVSVPLPVNLSERLQGQRIRITVSARRSGSTSPFAVAYSTGKGGTSGWIVFDPADTFKDFRFSYVVPRGEAGINHYVGVWPDIGGKGESLAIRRITITPKP